MYYEKKEDGTPTLQREQMLAMTSNRYGNAKL